jgi:hypothetical protein
MKTVWRVFGDFKPRREPLLVDKVTAACYVAHTNDGDLFWAGAALWLIRHARLLC